MDAMQHLVIDLETGTESRVDLTADELAEREQMAIADAERQRGEEALRAEIEDRRATLAADLKKVKDPFATRVLELVLLRMGEPIR